MSKSKVISTGLLLASMIGFANNSNAIFGARLLSAGVGYVLGSGISLNSTETDVAEKKVVEEECELLSDIDHAMLAATTPAEPVKRKNTFGSRPGVGAVCAVSSFVAAGPVYRVARMLPGVVPACLLASCVVSYRFGSSAPMYFDGNVDAIDRSVRERAGTFCVNAKEQCGRLAGWVAESKEDIIGLFANPRKKHCNLTGIMPEEKVQDEFPLTQKVHESEKDSQKKERVGDPISNKVKTFLSGK